MIGSLPKELNTKVINKCHVVTSHKPNSEGYPWFNRNGRYQKISRYVYETHHNLKLSVHEIVRHTCDNRMCVNIDHLVVGTTQQNTQDREDRNRGAKFERHGRSVLNKDKVKNIRKLLKMCMPQRQIARKFGVAQTTISAINRRIIWDL